MIYKGLQGLMESKKGTLSLLVLLCATAAVLMKKIDGVSYAAIISTISVIYNYVAHKVDVALMQAGNNGKGNS